MDIKLQDAFVGFSGKITGYTKTTLINHLRTMGARPSSSSSPVAGMDCFLAGERASKSKIEKAQALGIPVIQEELIYTLLEEGALSIDEEAGKKSLEELIGAARSLLALEPSHKTWLELCALVDECDSDNQSKLMDYLEPQLEQWPEVVVSPESPRQDRYKGQFGMAAGRLRTMPSHWLTELASGVEHEKFRLCRALTFFPVALNNTLSIKVLEHKAMRHVTTLDVAAQLDRDVKKKSFFKKMATCENLENVQTLVLGRTKGGVSNELLGATSMPNLTAIYLRADMYRMPELDHGAELLFGPWSKQLVTVGASHVTHLRVLQERIEELPSLEHLALHIQAASKKEVFQEMAQHLSALAPHLKRVSLAPSSYYPYASHDGLGDWLDAISSNELEVLDLEACFDTTLRGASGRAYMDKHFIDNGLVDSVQTIKLNDQVEQDLCDLLRSHGVNVISPLQPALADETNPEPKVEFISQVAPGEKERQDKGLVDLHDAMMFEEPCAEAWQVLISVVNGLEVQCEASEFEEAIEKLEGYLESWPEPLRVLPVQWWGALTAPKSSVSKLKLVRALHLNVSQLSTDVRAAARWISWVSESPDISHLTHIKMEGFEGQKAMQKAIVDLFRAIQPSSCELSGFNVKASADLRTELEGEGLLPKKSSSLSTPSPVVLSSLDVYEMRHVAHRVTSVEQMQEVLNLSDLDHVVSLSLNIDLDWEGYPNGVDWSVLKAKEASFKSLRHLHVTLGAHVTEELFGPLATWLGRARPLYVSDRFASFGSTPRPVRRFIQAGIYHRAYASHIELPNVLSLGELGAILGDARLSVASIGLMFGDRYQAPEVSDLVEAMHPQLRSKVRMISWITSSEDWPQIDVSCAKLPNLSMLCLMNYEAFHTVARRADYLAHLLDFKCLSGLNFLGLSSRDSRIDKLSAKELKPFKKHESLPNNLMVSGRFWLQWAGV